MNSGKSFYLDSNGCVCVGMDVSGGFPVRIGLKQGCLMFIWMVWCYNNNNLFIETRLQDTIGKIIKYR